jgi:acetyltransferase-like isoleucine patch superfamily enzyme
MKSNILKYFVKIFLILGLFFWTVIAYLKLRPLGFVGKGFRAEGPIYLTAISGNIHIGRGVRLGPNVRLGVANNSKIIIGDNVSINQGSVIVAYERVEVGDNTRVGEYVSLRDNDHGWQNIDMLILEQGYIVKPCVVGKDVWVGRSSTIMKGVTIGDKVVIGANSVVTRNVERGKVMAGVPAREISKRV